MHALEDRPVETSPEGLADFDDAVAFVETHARRLPLAGAGVHQRERDGLLAPFREARVVALGEPGHEHSPALQFRNALFRLLVEHAGFTAIGLETGITEARLVDAYICGAAGKAPAIAADGLTWGFGRRRENVALVAWLRRHNAALPADRRVRLYGFDLPGGEAGKFIRPRVAVDAAIAVAGATLPDMALTLSQLLGHFTSEGYARSLKSERGRLRQALEALAAHLEDRHALGVGGERSTEDRTWGLRNICAALQVEAALRASNGTAWTAASAAVREAAMADNVRWIFECERARGGLLLFAHNAHVMDAELRGDAWAAAPPRQLGSYLRAAFGRDLRLVGSVVDGAGLANDHGLEALVAGLSPSLIGLAEATPASAAGRWLHAEQQMHAGDSVLRLAPARAFDLLAVTPRAHDAPTPRAPRPADGGGVR